MGRIVDISDGELEDIKPLKNFGLSLIGTDSRAGNTAFAEVNGKIGFIKCKESAKAYTAGYENGTFIRREIELTLI